MKAKFFILFGVIFLLRLQGKFDIDHSSNMPRDVVRLVFRSRSRVMLCRVSPTLDANQTALHESSASNCGFKSRLQVRYLVRHSTLVRFSVQSLPRSTPHGCRRGLERMLHKPATPTATKRRLSSSNVQISFPTHTMLCTSIRNGTTGGSSFWARNSIKTRQTRMRKWEPSTLKSDQFQISPAASPEIYHHTVRRTWLFIAYSDGRWSYYQFSLPYLHISFWKDGRMCFLNLGVKGSIKDAWTAQRGAHVSILFKFWRFILIMELPKAITSRSDLHNAFRSNPS